MNPSAAQVGHLEIAARTLDLTTALLNAASSSNFIVKGAWEIGQWLGREKLNQYELLDCMEKSKGLAFANEKGRSFFDNVISGVGPKPAGPLFLQQSGSLGRLMAGDPKLSWMVSTTACLFQHHRDDRVVTDKLMAFILSSHDEEATGGPLAAAAAIYQPENTRLRVVVRKIVSSVWYNVVNAGCDTIPLPQELLDVCPRGHFVAPVDFGIITHTINAKDLSKSMLRTDHLLRDVVLWLLLHYNGTLVVTVGSRIVYKAVLGDPQRELEVRVAEECDRDGRCRLVERESYQILSSISGKLEQLRSGSSMLDSDTRVQPGVRQKLYQVPRLYPDHSPMWDRDIEITLKWAAQSTMRWMLGVQLSAQKPGWSSLGFSVVNTRESAPPDEIPLSKILGRIPAMVSLQWGNTEDDVPVVFAGPGEPVGGWASHPLGLLDYFPILQEAVEKVSEDCHCSDCTRGGQRRSRLWSATTPTPRKGCLGRAALEEFLLLLAHGITDGMGVDDVASVRDVAPIVDGMTVLLMELVQEGRVLWDTWFAVASATYLGCPFEARESAENRDVSFASSAFAAMQFGNLATQASWLDLRRELCVDGCFGLVGLRGRLGVVTSSEELQGQFRGVEENFAIIETESTQNVTMFCSRNPKDSLTVDLDGFRSGDDTSTMDSDVILYQVDDRFYRMLLRVKSRAFRRIVDPSDALSAVIRMLPAPAPCSHENRLVGTSATVRVYTGDEMLGRWPENAGSLAALMGPPLADIFLTDVMDTHLKKNTALALSVRGVAVPYYPELTCLVCAVDHAGQAGRAPSHGGNKRRQPPPTHRFIISLSTQLEAQHDRWRRLLIGASG